MLNLSQISELLAYLLADSGRTVRIEKVQVWFDQFRHLEPEVAWSAAKLLNVRGFKEWEPRTSEFREAIAEVTRAPEDKISGDEAFALAVSAIKRFGSYQKERVFSSLPARVAHALDRFGFTELCCSEEKLAGVTRAQFARIYDSTAKREDFSNSIKPGLDSSKLSQLPDVQKLLGGKI